MVNFELLTENFEYLIQVFLCQPISSSLVGLPWPFAQYLHQIVFVFKDILVKKPILIFKLNNITNILQLQSG